MLHRSQAIYTKYDFTTNICYSYGFGGQESDDEVNGVTGSSYTAEYWQYDSRLGRRWNPDPITYPWQSTYATFNNNPIVFSDPLGLFGTRKEARKAKKNGVESGRVRKNKKDGNFEIYNKKKGTTLAKDDWSTSGYSHGTVARKTKLKKSDKLSSNPVYRMMQLNNTTDFGTGIHFDKNYVHKESQWMKDFNRVVNGSLTFAFAPAAIGIVGPSLLARQSFQLAAAKTGTSAFAQAILIGKVNIIGAISDGLLIPGASDISGAAFELNISTQGFSTTSILSVKNATDVAVEASISLMFNMGLSATGKGLKLNDVEQGALVFPADIAKTGIQEKAK